MGQREQSFRLGHTCVTLGVEQLLPRALISALFARHARRDWGDVSPEDALENSVNADCGGRVRSVYTLAPEGLLPPPEGHPEGYTARPEHQAARMRAPVDVWIITEGDRFESTLLLPSEYLAWEESGRRLNRKSLAEAASGGENPDVIHLLKQIDNDLRGSPFQEGKALPLAGLLPLHERDFFVWLEKCFTLQFWSAYCERRSSRSSARGEIVPGLDRMSEDEFATHIDEMYRQIQKTLRDRTFRFRFFRRLDSIDGEKLRHPALPVMRDRLLDTIIARYLIDFLGIAPHPHVLAVSRDVQRALAKGTHALFFRGDIANFFESVGHERLFAWLEQKGLPDEVVYLARELAATPRVTPEEMKLYRIDHGREGWEGALRRDFAPSIGLPRGLFTSNVLAEAYLSDWFARHPLPKTVAGFRYVDDMLFLCPSQNSLLTLRRALGRMEKELGVALSTEKTCSGGVDEGFDFLGFFHKPNYARRSERSVKRFKMRWIEALEDPIPFLARHMNIVYLHGLLEEAEDMSICQDVLFGLVVYYYNLSIIGWGEGWHPSAYEFAKLQHIYTRMLDGQIEMDVNAVESNIRERFIELNRDLTQIRFAGSALYNSFCTDFRQIDELNRWAGRLFAGHARRLGLPPPRLVNHLKWYFFFRKRRRSCLRKVMHTYILLHAEKTALLEKIKKNSSM